MPGDSDDDDTNMKQGKKIRKTNDPGDCKEEEEKT